MILEKPPPAAQGPETFPALVQHWAGECARHRRAEHRGKTMARPFDHIKPKLTHLGPEDSDATGVVLFLHGAWHGSWCWTGLAEPVARAGYSVHMLDLPGHGHQSWELPPTTSLNDYAQVVSRAVEELGGPILIGHSMGGWLIQKMLERNDLPSILLAPLPGSGLPLGGLARLMTSYPGKLLKTFFGGAVEISDPGMYRRVSLAGGQEVPGLESILANLSPEPARVTMEMGLGLARAKPAPGGAPRLLVAADQDFFLPLGAVRALAQRLGARLEVVENCGHHLWLADGGVRVSKLILDFLQGLA